MQGFEQVCGGADALDGGFEDVFRVGLAWVSMSSVGVSVTLLMRGR
jgi:hypothetical protein